MNNALLIIDVQNDFLPEGALPVPEGNRIIPYINKLQQEFPLVIASMDWHPPHHCSFYTSYDNKKVGDTVVIGGQEQRLWPPHCVQNSAGASFASDLDITAIQHVIHKGTNLEIDSYSAFFDNQSHHATALPALLQQLNITELHMVGLAADYCVYFSALDARKLGISVHVHKKGVQAIDLATSAFADMEEQGVILH